MQVKLSPWETVGFSLGSFAMFVIYWLGYDTHDNVVSDFLVRERQPDQRMETLMEATGYLYPSECIWLVPGTLDVNA